MSMRDFIVIFAALALGCGTVKTYVGEEALLIIQDEPRVVMPLVVPVGVPMPKKPQEGQKRPPCSAGQVAVNGACWAGPIKGQEAPCPLGMFDHEGECYFAIFDAPRTPTSDPP